MALWAAELGLPRRVFCLPAGEAKPVYVDFQSAALTRNLHRMLGRAAAADPDAHVRFAEMLPGPNDCWLSIRISHRRICTRRSCLAISPR